MDRNAKQMTKTMYVVVSYPDCETTANITSVVLGVSDTREGAEEKVRIEIEEWTKVVHDEIDSDDPCKVEGEGDVWMCSGYIFRIEEVILNDKKPRVM